MNRRDFTERDIHMALDGELPAEDAGLYRAWLEANPEMKARTSRYEADRERLKLTLDPVLIEALPARLSRSVSGEPGSTSIRATWWRAAAAAVLIFCAGAAGGYLAGTGGVGQEAHADDRLAEEAIAAHRVYSAEGRHAVEVAASDKDHLLGWLSRRIGLTLVAPDLAAAGFELVGGRLLPTGEKTAALLLYQDLDGNRISVYVTADVGATGKGTYQLTAGGPSAVYWIDEGYGCAVVGSLPREKLIGVARDAYRQLLVGAGLA